MYITTDCSRPPFLYVTLLANFPDAVKTLLANFPEAVKTLLAKVLVTALATALATAQVLIGVAEIQESAMP